MTDKRTPYNVVILGAGALGTFTALELAARGVERIALIDDSFQFDWLSTSLGVAWPSPNDPPTRAQVAHGQDIAQYLTAFCMQGIGWLRKRFPDFEFQSPRTIRLALQQFESIELDKAVAAGMGLRPTQDPSCFEETGHAVTFNSGLFAKAVSAQLALARVEQKKARAVRLIEHAGGCDVQLADGSCLQAELVVLAGSWRTAELLPGLRDVLVPMSDILCEWTSPLPAGDVGLPSVCWRAASGHAAGSLHSGPDGVVRIRTTGPRFLLPSAGAGLVGNLSQVTSSQEVLAKIEAFQLAKILPALVRISPPLYENAPAFEQRDRWQRVKDPEVRTDCLPCDELPVLGELGRLGRVLGGAGWLGTGISCGAQAARCLADLVLEGKSDALHPRLSPRRFDTR